MLEIASKVFVPRPQRTPGVEGRAVAPTPSRCLCLLWARARAEERRRIARDLHDGAQRPRPRGCSRSTGA
jgi:hypothetical protein